VEATRVEGYFPSALCPLSLSLSLFSGKLEENASAALRRANLLDSADERIVERVVYSLRNVVLFGIKHEKICEIRDCPHAPKTVSLSLSLSLSPLPTPFSPLNKHFNREPRIVRSVAGRRSDSCWKHIYE